MSRQRLTLGPHAPPAAPRKPTQAEKQMRRMQIKHRNDRWKALGADTEMADEIIEEYESAVPPEIRNQLNQKPTLWRRFRYYASLFWDLLTGNRTL